MPDIELVPVMNTATDALLQGLGECLSRMLPDARLCWQRLPQAPSIGLWLLDPLPLRRPFSAEEVRAIEDWPAYWAFCWASGQWLARYLLENPHIVAGKTVLDFGAGSGVAGIAAARAGASRVVACDIDADALAATRLNALANGVEAQIELAGDVFALHERFDVVLAADVLYDRANLPLLDHLLARGEEVWVADSRIRNFSRAGFVRCDAGESFTLPDLDESMEFRRVTLYTGREVS